MVHLIDIETDKGKGHNDAHRAIYGRIGATTMLSTDGKMPYCTKRICKFPVFVWHVSGKSKQGDAALQKKKAG